MARTKEVVYEQYSFSEAGEAQLPRRLYTRRDVERLHEALEPFVQVDALRRLIADGRAVHEAVKTDTPPPVIRALMYAVTEVLRPTQKEQIKSPRDAAGYFMALLGEAPQEEFHVMALNTKNRVIGTVQVYKGSVNSAQVRIAEIYREAIRMNAVAIICAHNHPSGDCTPSPEDIMMTRQVVEAGKLLDCETLDHIICSKGAWVSLREKGLGFPT